MMNRFKIDLRILFKRVAHLILILAISFILVLPGAVALGQEDSCTLAAKSGWQNKFPLGFVLGTPPNSDFFNTCPEIEIFGYKHEVCAIKTLLDTLKNVVLIKFIINSLQNL
jgi:hypothetical protein